ncbi:MAG: glutaredoxin [Spirochaetales bacterium]|nr:glutaredoxin [Spirochaetales bacterium]
MFDVYPWKVVEGKGTPEELSLLSLSTCGFCASARNYLNGTGRAFRYLELDTLPPEEKSEMKAEFRERFGRRPSFPSLVIKDERFLVGFIKEHWEEELQFQERPQ